MIDARIISYSSSAVYLRTVPYTFFQQVGGLIQTGPTHTSVCDVRVVVVDRIQPQVR